MTTLTAPATVTAPVIAPPIKHIFCVHHGDPAKSICGTPRSVPVESLRVIGRKYPMTRTLCVVCLDLAPHPCPECGG
jgi:hypothetical protein